ncbi:MAG: sensor histidine kinase, partial [Paraclostridium sp.]
MIEKYIYSHNEELKYLSEEELKHRSKLVEPLFIQKLTWYLLLIGYCIWARRNLDISHINFLEFMTGFAPNSAGFYLLIVIYIVIIFTGIKLIIKTVELYAISSTSNNETEFIIKKKMFKKWSTYILNTMFSISLINYIIGGGVFLGINIGEKVWFNILMISIFIKTIAKLIGLAFSKIRIAMISGALEDSIQEVENGDFNKVADSIRELVGNGKDIEAVYGLGFKHILIEIVKLFEKIEDISKKEKELYQNKNHLITNLSHDLKTPLTSIINAVYILKNEKLNEGETKEQVEILEKKMERLNTLIKDLNETVYSRYDGLVVNKKIVNIKELIKNELDVYESKFKKLNLDTKTNFPTTDVSLFLDEEKTIRIIDNVLSNISKYSLEDTRVYIDIIINADDVQIVFRNISKYDIAVDINTIGERFVQGDKSRNIDGNGLGLSIIKSLVGIQGGNVVIDIQGDLFKLILKF